MIGIGITLSVLSIILFAFIIREKERFHFVSDPICGSLTLLFIGLYIMTEITFGPLIHLANNTLAFETKTFLLGVVTPFILFILAGTIAGIRWRHRKYGKPKKIKRKQPKERVRWSTKKKPSDTLKNTESSNMK